MKKTFLVVIIAMTTSLTHAQIPIETLVGNRQVHYINFWQRDIDSAGRFNFFNLNRFAIDYKHKALSSFSTEGQLSYRIKNWVGLSIGGGFDGQNFVPTVGLNLSYANEKGDFFVDAYPTLSFGERIAPSVLGLVGYNPKFNTIWGLAFQGIFSLDESQTSQLLRIGLSYKGKVEFGFGADLYQFRGLGAYLSNIGVFTRLNL